MDDAQRFWLFWLCCIPFRAAIAVGGLLLPTVDTVFFLFYGIYCLLTSVGLTTNVLLWCSGNASGVGGLGGRVWWARVRVVHAALWLSAALAFAAHGPGGWILVADVIVGALAGFLHAFGVEL